ncbi:hypothetical protein ACF1AU_03660 [Streptomyces rubrogriseus]|uniref:hypothetical protein n=1 Tax=Streptomyces rubrogriseus TaxID=194673 RepID=UPI003701AD62
MIKLTWTLIAQHVDEWTGDDASQGAAVLEARVGAVVDASGMKSETVQHWRADFLAPVVTSAQKGRQPLPGASRGARPPDRSWRAPLPSPRPHHQSE